MYPRYLSPKTKTYIIAVTNQDIANGRRKDMYNCPIALAAQRRFKTRASVYYNLLVDLGGPWMAQFYLPQKAVEFVRAFDAAQPVKPIRFQVEQSNHNVTSMGER